MRRILLLLVFAIGAVSAGMAQDTVWVLTFKGAVKMALDKNIDLLQQQNLLVSTKVDQTSGLLAMGPTVGAYGSFGRNNGNSFNQQEGRVINGELDFTRGSIEASLPIFRGFYYLNNYRQLSSAHEAQMHKVKQTYQEIIRAVVKQYLQCLLDQRIVIINEKNLETQKQQYDQIREQVAAGARAEVDLKNQEYQVKNAELLLLRAKNTLWNNKTILGQSLRIDPAINFELREPSWPMWDYENLTLDELFEIALQQRSDLLRAQANEKSARYGYLAAKGNYFPSVSAFLSYGSAYNYVHPSDIIQNPNNRTFEQQFLEDNTQLNFGLSFRIPIHNAMTNRANTVRMRMQYENAQLETEKVRIVVKAEVTLIYQNIIDAKAALEAAEAQLKAAEVSNELERERYNLGISDIVSLTESNQALIRAQSEYESARYTLMFQRLLVGYTIGTLKFEDIP